MSNEVCPVWCTTHRFFDAQVIHVHEVYDRDGDHVEVWSAEGTASPRVALWLSDEGDRLERLDSSALRRLAGALTAAADMADEG